MKRLMVMMWIVGAGLAVSQCGTEDEAPPPEMLQSRLFQAPGEMCPAGGVRLVWGGDANHNGYVDPGEIARTLDTWCNVACGNGMHDGGDGQCVEAEACSPRHHIAGHNQCIETIVMNPSLYEVDKLCFQGFTYTDDGCVEKSNG